MKLDSLGLRIVIVCLIAIFLCALVWPAEAQSLRDDDANGHQWDEVVGGNGHVYTVWLIGRTKADWTLTTPTAAEMKHLKDDFPKWNFSQVVLTEPAGTLSIVAYDAYVRGVDVFLPGTTSYFRVAYVAPDGGTLMAQNHVFQWIQFVNMSDPPTAIANSVGVAPGRTFLDPYDYAWNGTASKLDANEVPYSDGTPFYDRNNVDAALGTSERERNTQETLFDNTTLQVVSRFTFTDRPYIPFTRALQHSVYFEAHLFLVEWDGNIPGNVTIYGGVRWGFTMVVTRGSPGVGAGPRYYGGGAAGDAKYIDIEDNYTVNATMISVGQVGGVTTSVDKFGLLAPYIGLTSTLAVVAVATSVCVKRVKRRKEKQ